MSGWRSKLILLLIVYFSGFSTAIYILAPPPENSQSLTLGSLAPSHSGQSGRLTNEEFVESFNAGLHKAVAFGKVVAVHTGSFLKARFEEATDACNRAPN